MEQDTSMAGRLDRELMELLNELRVALPGVQVLFAFLLILPFSTGFTDLATYQDVVFLASLLCTAGATAMLAAPSAYHRLRFRERDKERMIRVANRLAVGGLVLVAVAMSLVVFLVTDVVFALPAAVVVGVLTAGVFAVLWFALPLSGRSGRNA
jgi:hypothetical protein